MAEIYGGFRCEESTLAPRLLPRSLRYGAPVSEVNPYEAPRAPKKKKRRKAEDAEPDVDIESHRMSVLVALGLSVVTFGLFSFVWYFLRKPLFEALRQAPLSPLGVVAAYALGFGGAFGVYFQPANEIVFRAASVIGGILIFLVQRQLGHIITSAAYARRLDVEISGLALWFFGVPYLQWGVNQLADGVQAAGDQVL